MGGAAAVVGGGGCGWVGGLWGAIRLRAEVQQLALRVHSPPLRFGCWGLRFARAGVEQCPVDVAGICCRVARRAAGEIALGSYLQQREMTVLPVSSIRRIFTFAEPKMIIFIRDFIHAGIVVEILRVCAPATGNFLIIHFNP